MKDGVEAHLQELLAEQVPQILGEGWELVRREFPTPVGPVDLMVRDADGAHVAIEVKRRGGIDGVEQLTRYLALLGRDPLLGDVTGIFAAQEITKQARTLAEDRGIRCVVLDYDAMRGWTTPSHDCSDGAFSAGEPRANRCPGPSLGDCGALTAGCRREPAGTARSASECDPMGDWRALHGSVARSRRGIIRTW